METTAVRISGPLSPLDQFMPVTYTRLFLVFQTSNQAEAVKSLQEGLEKTCYQIPYIKGTISRQSFNRNLLAISWSVDTPVPQLEHITATLPSLDTLTSEGAPLSYFTNNLSPLGVRPLTGPDAEVPAFAASYTQIDGGLVLCICVHHTLMDGTGVGELIRVWAANTKSSFPAKEMGLDNAEPMHRLYLLTGKKSPSEIVHDMSVDQLMRKHPEFARLSATNAKEMVSAPQAPSISKIFNFKVSKISAAKVILAQKHGITDATAYHILAAVVWSSVCRIRHTRLGDKAPAFSKLGFAVNGRKYLNKDVSEKVYTGNINLFGLAMLSTEKLDAAVNAPFPTQSESSGADLTSLVPIIQAKMSAISRVTASYIAEVISLIQQSPDVTDIIPGWNALDGLDLTMTSWANLPVYDCDFGEQLGKPKFVRPPFAQWDGLTIILPRRRQEVSSNTGSKGDDDQEEVIEVITMLRKDDIESLEKDHVWRSWTE
jgi:trichothecene 3-O-acetyltransferase